MSELNKVGVPHILFVDDEESARVLFSLKFKQEIADGKILISYAEDGVDALDIIKRMGGELVLINSDINMPNMDGYELLKNVKKDYPAIIVNMVSAYGTDEFVDKALALGANKYFTKPIDFNKLKENIDQIIDCNKAA